MDALFLLGNFERKLAFAKNSRVKELDRKIDLSKLKSLVEKSWIKFKDICHGKAASKTGRELPVKIKLDRSINVL